MIGFKVPKRIYSPIIGSDIVRINEKTFKVLEDNCESMGAKYRNKFLGTVGDAGIISYDFGKTITCGEGGMILTNNKKIDKYSREYHDHGHELNPKYPRGMDTVTIVGFNYRMNEFSAAIALAQCERVNFFYSNLYKFSCQVFNFICLLAVFKYV